MAVRTPAAAVTWARVPRSGYGGLCLAFTRQAYNVPALHYNANTAWDKAVHRHAGLTGIRLGAPLFMTRPSSVHGHVAIWLGASTIATTDSGSKYTRVDPLSRWTNAGWKIRGWTEDINGVRVLPKTTTTPGTITVDGIWGSGTTKLAQKVYATPVDGVVSGQNTAYKKSNPGLGSGWSWVSGKAITGSTLIKAVQKTFGVKQDGIIGPTTIKAMQKFYGIKQDGVLSKNSPTVKKFQQALNAGKKR